MFFFYDNFENETLFSNVFWARKTNFEKSKYTQANLFGILLFQTKFDCNYLAPIDLAPIGISIGAKSIVKC